MRQTLFISDLHLCEQRPELTQAFFTFLEEKACESESLYILGDFFDVWIGDDNDDPLIFEVANALRMLSEAGTQVFLMHGNRDFLIGRHFCRLSGARLLDEPRITEIYGQRCVLMHGDSLCTRDEEYMKLRAMFRDPAWQKEFLQKPLEERRAFAENARSQSKSMNSNKAEDIMDVTPAEVMKLFSDTGANLLIHGHTHRPDIHEIGQWHRRIVLGDWGSKGWYLKLAPEECELLPFYFA